MLGPGFHFLDVHDGCKQGEPKLVVRQRYRAHDAVYMPGEFPAVQAEWSATLEVPEGRAPIELAGRVPPPARFVEPGPPSDEYVDRIDRGQGKGPELRRWLHRSNILDVQVWAAQHELLRQLFEQLGLPEPRQSPFFGERGIALRTRPRRQAEEGPPPELVLTPAADGRVP